MDQWSFYLSFYEVSQRMVSQWAGLVCDILLLKPEDKMVPCSPLQKMTGLAVERDLSTGGRIGSSIAAGEFRVPGQAEW